MCSTFLKLAILTGDDFALLLAAEAKQAHQIPKPKFEFETYDPLRCKRDFRFEKQDIVRLKLAFGIPDVIHTAHRVKFPGIEGLCLLLRRLAYPNRYSDLQIIFGRDTKALSHIFNSMLDFMYDNFRHLVLSIDQWWLALPYLRQYAHAIKEKGAPLSNCFGFIDGTVHRICRPGKNQREVYSGHKRVHCLKYQSVVTPNGLIANLYGPELGRRHDSYTLRRSGIMQKLETVIGAERLYLYGDCGYPMRRYLITPLQKRTPTPEEVEFNKSMSRLRISVEWEFGDLYDQFAFLSYKRNQKLHLQPVGKYFIVATILKNCKTCLYGSQTSSYFNVNPPELENYVKNCNIRGM